LCCCLLRIRILILYRDVGRSENSDSVTKNRSPSPTLSSLPEDSPHAKILRLLRVLCQLNTIEAERVVFVGDKRNLSDSAFVNNKLTAKLSRQLEEPMIVARLVLPSRQNYL
jgi:E3 ubiquitin-protein ligase TRIP12